MGYFSDISVKYSTRWLAQWAAELGVRGRGTGPRSGVREGWTIEEF